ncbi:MAG TPA: hypothetical protein VL486_05650 [Verrucomicrobiae bacterium]|nr:hypothetical protein [Verrucomicrobiae bacterium]
MNSSILLGITLGTLIGGAFAWMQLRAARRNELLQRQQQSPEILRQVPGSLTRVAFLLMALVAVQVFFPQADKWCLSGALVVAYGIPFFWRLRDRIPQAR